MAVVRPFGLPITPTIGTVDRFPLQFAQQIA
jgi:hypothetical protein